MFCYVLKTLHEHYSPLRTYLHSLEKPQLKKEEVTMPALQAARRTGKGCLYT